MIQEMARARTPTRKPSKPASSPQAASSPAPVPEPTATARKPPGITGAAFWALMDRWQIADEDALRLIGHAGGLTAKGKRPRFALNPEQSALMARLREIDQHLVDTFGEPGPWLLRKNSATLFNGRTPLQHMIAAPAKGIAECLRFLEQWSFRASLAKR